MELRIAFGRQPEQRQDHPVQFVDRFQPVRGQLAGSDGGEKGGQAEKTAA